MSKLYFSVSGQPAIGRRQVSIRPGFAFRPYKKGSVLSTAVVGNALDQTGMAGVSSERAIAIQALFT